MFVFQFIGFITVQYIALCDIDKKHREKAMGLINAKYENKDSHSYNDFREFLEKEKLDAIHIAVPDLGTRIRS